MSLRLRMLPVLAALILPAATASAQSTVAPPGNSGVDQYFEAVPGATGATPAQSGRKPVLPSATRRKLDAAGKDGAAVSRIVDQTAPDAVAKDLAKQSGGSESRR